MSDYVEAKVIRLPIKKLIEKLGVDSAWECEDYLKEKLGDLYENHLEKQKKYFQIEYTYDSAYIDYVYYYTYGESSGDFGHISLLSDKELQQIKPLFDKIEIEYNDKDLRKVHYCYYNAAECEDYYGLKEMED